MRDSRIGTYGALALGLSVAIRTAALAIAPLPIATAALVAAHGGGRLAGANDGPVALYGRSRGREDRPFDRRVPHPEQAIACAFALIGFVPLCLLAWPVALAAVAVGTALAIVTACLYARLIRGYTGDVLGAVEQMFEIGVLLTAAAAWSR